MGGSSYIDSVVLRDRDPDGGWAAVAQGASKYRNFYITDSRYSPAALVDAGGRVVERVAFDPYGQPTHRWPGDIDGDGFVDSADQALIGDAAKILAAIGDAGYLADGDLNRDGLIDGTDEVLFQEFYGRLPVVGVSDPSGADSPVGLSGYVYSRESALYCVRFRWLDPALGRWLTPDPIGYADGSNLYEYVGGNPWGYTDPSGLFWGLGGADEDTIQEYRDKNCAALVQARDSGKLSQKCFEMLWVNGHCGQSVSDEIDQAHDEALVDGLIEGATDPHTILDALGQIPVLGEIADGANATLYMLEGDYINAGISVVGMIPGWGNAATAGRIIGRAGLAAGTIIAARKVHKNSKHYVGPMHGYVIYHNGKMWKAGISADAIDKYGRSVRAEKQAKEGLRTLGGHWSTEIVEHFGNRADAEAWETWFVESYRYLMESLPWLDRLPGNPLVPRPHY